MIEYRTGNILHEWHNPNVVIVHSCNSQGVWGSGFAKQLALKVPTADGMQLRHCMMRKHEGIDVTGKAYLVTLTEPPIKIGCLFTSEFYGNKKSSPAIILNNTANAIRNLFDIIAEPTFEIHSPKINSGLFNVPWRSTEDIINLELIRQLKFDREIKWIVWELE